MTALFTSRFLTAALAVWLLAGVGINVLAQGNSTKFRPGKLTVKPADAPTGSHARINALVSRPGNSQDYVASGGGNWQIQSHSTYTYDTQGRLTQRLYTDPATNQNLGREKTTYDARGNEIEYRVEGWNGSAWELIDGYMTLISYDQKGNKTELISEYWDNVQNTWVREAREQTVYDANNLATSFTNSSWDGTTWQPEERIVLNNVGGVATSAVIQEYNSGVWTDAYRALNLTWHVLYEIPSAYVLETFDNNVWVQDEKYTAVYDANGGHVGTYENWNGTAWENFMRETETYDNNKNYTGWLDEDWNQMNNAWDYEGEDRQVLTYSGIDVTQRIYQDSWSSGTTTLEDRVKEVYSNFQTFNVSGVQDQLAEAAVNVYPNPASKMVTVSIPANKAAFTAIVADVTGKTWLTKTFQAGEENSVYIEALPKGIYLLQLQTESGTITKRIVKQ
ncbi:T9SS type A sorting domain-containing protein [Adhaeribacter sp. BT258]|uniref:T9SS type A sorting domain-containing protein n=1 Tax=Adhaeribacter terrigena TaxID=2793070 RepID=A0ABS1BWX2_9BACT|nr:T9SS type A sorting domain-containing protein [Adhaeribacter terrigena]MBK0401638.1 T9SS type A sorting domain-containing protein [Adhaeribacter terrigena]